MAGGGSVSWHPLVVDFLLVGQKLKKFGFVYNQGDVIIIEPSL